MDIGALFKSGYYKYNNGVRIANLMRCIWLFLNFKLFLHV